MPISNPSSGTPAGNVAHFAANAAPIGWIRANGSALSRVIYANLFLAIGETYGAGDGSTTFLLPDLRGEFLRSLDDGRGVDSGRVIGSFQSHQLQSHAHTFPRNYVGGSASVNGGFASMSTAQDTYTTSASGSTNNSSENRPRNKALLACIKY